MRDVPKTRPSAPALAAAAFLLLPLAAHAAEGAVKVACGDNNCNNVSLGQVCDTLRPGSDPIGLSCENTATPGAGTTKACGTNGGTCTPFGGLVRNDRLGAYCFGSNIGGTNDAVVICNTTPTAASAAADAIGKTTGR